MSSKDVILDRIRAALADGAPAPEIPRTYRREPAPVDMELLVERLIDYKAVVHRPNASPPPPIAVEGSGPQAGGFAPPALTVDGSGLEPGASDSPARAEAESPPAGDISEMSLTPGDAAGEAAAIRAVIAGILPRGVVVVPPGLPREWLPVGVDGLVDDGLSAERIAATDGVVTGAAVAVVETGTIVLDASADQGRRIISLLPDLHICVIRPEQVVASVPEAVERLDPTRPLTWISGPSATSDIELNRVEGVHGPRNLHIILLPGG
jgi:L-lactate dehydrogenase complex protein LldG